MHLRLPRLVLMAVAAAVLVGCGSGAATTSTAATSTTGSSTTQAATSTTGSVDTAATTSSSQPYQTERFVLDEDLSIRQVADGVYVIRHDLPWAANSMMVEMADGELVLVDTPYTPQATQQVLSWFEERLGSRQVTAINTGYHVDNLGGNQYLIDSGIPVYGSDETAALLAQRGEDTRALLLSWLTSPDDARYWDAQAAVPYVAPDHLYPLDEGLELHFGSEAVQVWFPGPTHAPDNVVVYFPSHRLLFGGCMILSADSVGNDADADLAAWPLSVARLDRFDVDIVVPGHGDGLEPGLIAHTIAVLTAQG
jgi:metallo-beta-lactamase class B